MAGSLLTAKVSLELDGASKVKAEMIAEARSAADSAGTAAGKDFGNTFAKNSRIRVDTSSAQSDIKKLGSEATKSNSGMSLLLKSALTLGPALIPIGGAGVAAIAGIAATTAAAGIGFASLGAVAVPAITNIKNALKDAGKDGAAALDSLTPAEKNLYGATHELNTAYQAWYKTLEPDVLPKLAGGLNTVQSLLPKFTGTVKSAANGTGDFLQQIDAAVNGPIFATFTKNLASEAGPAISATGHLLLGLGSAATTTFNDLAPLAPKVDSLFTSLGNKAAAGAQSQGFIDFLHTIESDAPLAGKTLGDLGSDAAGLVGALAPLGDVSLKGIDGLLTTIQPLIPAVKNLATAIDDNVGALSPVIAGYAHLATTIGTGLLGTLTTLVNLAGNNATAFQILADAIIAVKIGGLAKDALAGAKAISILTAAVKGYAGAETALGAAKGTEAVAGTAAGFERGATKASGFTGAVKGASTAMGGFSIAGIAAAGVLGAVTFGFSQASQENASFQSKLSGQFDNVSKSLGGLTLSQQQNALSTVGMINSGNGLLATWSNIGASGVVEDKYRALKQDTDGLNDAFTTFGKSAGVSGNQLYSMAKQVGYTDTQLQAIGALASKVEIEKNLNLPQATADSKALAGQMATLYGSIQAYNKSITLASDPTYNLGQAMADLDSKVPHDAIKDFNTSLDNYSTLAVGTTVSSAQAGDALAQLKGVFDKNTTSAGKYQAAQAVLSGDLLKAGPQTRTFSEDLAGLNAQYTANLESTFKAAGGASNLAIAGAAVTKTANEQKHALYDVLLGMGLNAGEASKLAEKYASIPKDITTQFKTSGATQAKNDAAGIDTAINRLKPGSIKFTGDDKDVRSKISALEKLIPTLPKSQQLKLQATVSDAESKLADAESKAKEVARGKYEVKLTAQNDEALAKSRAAGDAARNFAGGKYLAHYTGDASAAESAANSARARAQDYANGNYNATLKATDHASTTIGGVAQAARSIPDALVRINAQDNASGVIGGVSGELGRLNGSSATVYVNTVNSQSQAAGGVHIPGHARGGWSVGPGSAVSDSLLMRTSPGEFTTNALSSRANAALLEKINASNGPVSLGAGTGGSSTPAGPIIINVMLPDKRVLAQAVLEGTKLLGKRGAYG